MAKRRSKSIKSFARGTRMLMWVQALIGVTALAGTLWYAYELNDKNRQIEALEAQLETRVQTPAASTRTGEPASAVAIESGGEKDGDAPVVDPRRGTLDGSEPPQSPEEAVEVDQPVAPRSGGVIDPADDSVAVDAGTETAEPRSSDGAGGRAEAATDQNDDPANNSPKETKNPVEDSGSEADADAQATQEKIETLIAQAKEMLAAERPNTLGAIDNLKNAIALDPENGELREKVETMIRNARTPNVDVRSKDEPSGPSKR